MEHIHFIGIAGSAIAPIAIMAKSKGFKVTGSDANVYEPAKSLLTKHRIEWFEGYDASRVEDADLVIIGGAPLMIDINNPEFLRAKELKKPLYGYDHLLQKFVVKEESIVVCGSYGKTSTTAMLAWIFECAGKNPSFMCGGKPANFDTGVRSSDSNYSIMEGDEYLSVFGYDLEPRFTHYNAKYGVLSATMWDHVNVYPTEESYIEAFYKLAASVERNSGILFMSASGKNNDRIKEQYKGELVTYMVSGAQNQIGVDPNYIATVTGVEGDTTHFTISKSGESVGEYSLPMIGAFNVENALASFVVATTLGIDKERVKEGLSSFKGIVRRLQIRGVNRKGATVIDDFAHSPVKVRSAIEAVREHYSERKIIALYLPRQSSRDNRKELPMYEGVFDKADHVVIPHIAVKASTPKEDRVYGKDYIEVISKSMPNVHYIPKAEDVTDFLDKNSDQNTLLLFMSGGDWHGLIEEQLN